MPREFQGGGIAFLYPDNWTLDESDIRFQDGSVTVYSPGGAFWSVSAHPVDLDPLQLAEAAVEAMREEYPEVEVEEVDEAIGDQPMRGFDLSFFYLDLVNSAAVRCFHREQVAYAVFWQAEDRELKEIERVFQAMTVSFLNSLAPQGG